MRSCARTVAGLLIAIFVPLAVVALFLGSLQGFLMDAEGIQTGLREAGFYERAPAALVGEIGAALAEDPCGLLNEVCESGMGAALEAVPRASWERLLTQVITPAWLQAQVEPNMAALLAAVLEGNPAGSLRISLVEPKQILAQDLGVDLLREILATMPACTQRQLLELALVMQQGGEVGALLVCQPPPEIIAQVEPLVRSALADGIDGVPDVMEFDLAGLAGAADALERPLRLFRLGVVVSVGGALAVLLLIGLLAVRSWKDALIWWGLPVLLAGVSAWTLAMAGPPTIGLVLEGTLTAGAAHPLPSVAIPLIREMLQILIEASMRSMRTWAIFAAGAGAAMLILSRFVGSREGRLWDPLPRD